MKTTVYAGGWALGVRAGSLEIDALLRTLLGDRCRDDLDPPANYSISADAGSDDVAAKLPTLFGGHAALLRSRSVPLLVGGLLANLAAHDQAQQEGLLWLQATMLATSDGAALLAAPKHRRYVVDQLRALRRLGLRYHPATDVAVDVTTGEVVIDSLDGVNSAAAAVLDGDTDAADTLVDPGRYTVRGWAVVGTGGDQSPPLSAAQGVLQTFSLATNRTEIGAQQVLDTLGRIFVDAPALPVRQIADEVVAGLGQLAARG